MDTNVFDSVIEAGAETPVTPAAENKSAKKDQANAMKLAFQKALTDDPTLTDRLHRLSDSLEVINSLGYGESGNIIVDKARTAAENKRVLASVSKCFGYRVKNVGTEPIPYTTEEWTKGEDGRWVGQKVEKVMQPGDTADLTRQYMTLLAAQPEFSFKLKNGRISRGSGVKGCRGDIKAELEAHYFAFSKEAAEAGMEINSDEVKLNVGVKNGDGKWTVKPEFAATFGYLENVNEKTRGTRKADGPKYNSGDIAANWIRSMMAGENLG